MVSARQQHARRYGSLDQGLIHRLEARAVGRLLARLDPAPRTCLDAPCGYGRWSDILRSTCATTLLGADRDAARLAGYSSRAQPHVAVQADVGRLPFPDGAFDLVVSLRFLQHLRGSDDRVAVLRELRRVGSGHLLVSYYRAGGLHGLQRRLLPRYRRRPLGTLSPTQFQHEAIDAGWALLVDQPVWRGLHAQSIALLRIHEPGLTPLSPR